MLQDLLSEKLPKLMAHLGQCRVDLSFITFNWLLVVFADSLISNILLQVWDAFLYEGTKVGHCVGRGGEQEGPGQVPASSGSRFCPRMMGGQSPPVRAVEDLSWERGFVNSSTLHPWGEVVLLPLKMRPKVGGFPFPWRGGTSMTRRCIAILSVAPQSPAVSSSCLD